MQTAIERIAETRSAESLEARIGVILEKIQALKRYLRTRRCCLRHASACRRGHNAESRRMVFSLQDRLNDWRLELALAQDRLGPASSL